MIDPYILKVLSSHAHEEDEGGGKKDLGSPCLSLGKWLITNQFQEVNIQGVTRKIFMLVHIVW